MKKTQQSLRQWRKEKSMVARLAEQFEQKEHQVGRETKQLMDYLEEHYRFRYNTIMGYCEYHLAGETVWRPVDERVENTLAMEARMAGVNIWGTDVKRYLGSLRVKDYHPVRAFLDSVRGTWDGRDHIGRLAATVDCRCQQWPRWLRTWLLGVVAQWMGLNRQYGNSVVPLLISGQGFGKSTFCRQLLPAELRWGYTDSLLLGEKKQVLLAMSQMLLINLDEFNQISRKVQEGFLKNMLQLPVVMARRPYGKHVEELPRMASFIATTNMRDVLADISGNRRFMAIELMNPIDTQAMPDPRQLYAQVLDALERGERYWFDDQDTQALMEHNEQYEQHSPAEQLFHECFAPAATEADGLWMTAAAIFSELRKQAGAAIPTTALATFGRVLAHVDGLQHRRSCHGSEYLVTAVYAKTPKTKMEENG